MSQSGHSPADRDLLQETLGERVAALQAAVDQGDMIRSVELITELQEARHEMFYKEVGRLTRGLHEAIKSFSADVNDQLKPDQMTSVVMNDASDRLEHVIELTEKTSHETMDRVDRSLVLVDTLNEQSERFAALLSLVGQLEDEFEALHGLYDRTCQLRDESEQTVDELRGLLTEIVVSQGVQDITGQLIRRVITLLTQVESQLVSLVQMAAKVEHLRGLESKLTTESDAAAQAESGASGQQEVQPEGPQFRKGARDVAYNQDDVDDLLSSLGF